MQLRETLFDVPFYRLCHGEGDWLPGLVLDRYGDVFSAQITTAGMEAQKDALLEVLGELFTPKAVLLRNDVGVRTMENLPLLVETGMGTVPDEIEVRESGAAFTVSLAEGQKTGWFYDQRPNRVEAAKYAKGKTVLDAFCYAGAFGVMAARNGAAGVTFLDASRQALDMASRNLAANAGCPGEDAARRRWTRWRPCATGAEIRRGLRRSPGLHQAQEGRRTGPQRLPPGQRSGLATRGKRGHSYELFLFAPP
ncbi:MAG: class I SAM-dependent rRNA methyltransferase [Bilophila wadsworthia]